MLESLQDMLLLLFSLPSDLGSSLQQLFLFFLDVLGLHVIELYLVKNPLLLVLLSFGDSFDVLELVFPLDKVHLFLHHQVPVFLALSLFHDGILLGSLRLNVVNSIVLPSFHLESDFL